MKYNTDEINSHIFFSDYAFCTNGNNTMDIFDEKYKYIFEKHGNYKMIDIDIRNKKKKYIVFENGVIFSKHEYKDQNVISWGKVFNNQDRTEEFVYNGKWFNRAKFILFAFQNFDMNDITKSVDFIDGDKTNYRLNNLRIIDCEVNTTQKGYYFDTQSKKYKASIRINKRQKHLGYFQTEEEAHIAYVNAKKFGIFPNKAK